ncbi:glycosyltransferase [Metallumcola ferriviriculae]|uniref:Glycosyltransferase n=1 Tax=Metallumcola ferriviriculae TaxID=3039180 RepID=A0AAU0UTD3_9FIRM|nr:glycosyltransferase [Desulfitibacteraceae bacterium MK1]
MTFKKRLSYLNTIIEGLNFSNEDSLVIEDTRGRLQSKEVFVVYTKMAQRLEDHLEIALQILVNKGYKISICPFEDMDIEMCEKFACRYQHQDVRSLDYTINHQGALTVLNQCYFSINLAPVVNTLSLALLQPVLQLNYNDEISDYFSKLKLKELLIDIDQLTAGVIINKVADLEDGFKEVVTKIEEIFQDCKFDQTNDVEEELRQHQQQVKSKVEALITEGYFEDAKEILTEYEAVVSNDIDLYSMKAIIAIMKKSLNEAEIYLKKGLDLEPNNFDLLYNLGYLYTVKGLKKQASNTYQRALPYVPSKELKDEITGFINQIGQGKGSSGTPLTSIVILTYNNLEYSKLCIDSIRKYTAIDSYELIVVDNHSADGTVQWLKEQRDIRCIFNKENYGFPKGCNQGIQIAAGDSILLLNNDTVVTPNWLDNLKAALDSSKDIGAVGAVTNSCSNYQVVPAQYTNLEEMFRFANKYNVSDANKWEERLRLVGFCMLIRKEVVDKVGLLDEQFTPGNFEDDDYSLRVRQAGYRLLLCKDTFIHHFGSASFGKRSEAYNQLLRTNSKKFQAKWGVDPYHFIEIRKDITDVIKENVGGCKNILQVGCTGGGTLLDIGREFPQAELFGVEDINVALPDVCKFATIRSNLKSFDGQRFDCIIITSQVRNLKHFRDTLATLAEYLEEAVIVIASIPSELDVENKQFGRQLKKLFQNYSLKTINTERGLLACLKIGHMQAKLPLVSILIPAFNRPDYLEIALNSVLAQTYEKIEIVICDDSTTDDVGNMIQKYLTGHSNIRYYRNETNLGQFDNDLRLLGLAEGEYINFLMDDDVFEVEKIEKMMRYYLQDMNEEIKLVTSHRQMINKKGMKLPKKGVTQQLFKEDTVLKGIEFGDLMLRQNFNCIGEPTTVLFRKKDLIEPFGCFNGRKYGCNVDIATWLNLLSQGKAVYIAETLSYFRIHDEQQLSSLKMKLLGAMDYAHEVLTAREKGFLVKEKDFNETILNCQNYITYVLNDLKEKNYNQTDVSELQNFQQKLLNLKQKTYMESRDIEITAAAPLVSILIPAYNKPDYLEAALNSSLNQTYPNIEIIIGDDSTNNKVEKRVSSYLKKYDNIKYFRNLPPVKDFGLTNVKRCLEKSCGEYINFLMHDDMFHPQKIEKMISHYQANNNVTLVTSYRHLIDEKGEILSPLPATKKLFNETTVVKGKDLGRFIIKNLINVIGEPTTVLIKKEYLGEDFGLYTGKEYCNLIDVASWLTLLNKGDAVYISEGLSYFRQHEDQNQKNTSLHVMGIIEWYRLVQDSFKVGLLDRTEYLQTIKHWFVSHASVLKEVDHTLSQETKAELYNIFNEALGLTLFEENQVG